MKLASAISLASILLVGPAADAQQLSGPAHVMVAGVKCNNCHVAMKAPPAAPVTLLAQLTEKLKQLPGAESPGAKRFVFAGDKPEPKPLAVQTPVPAATPAVFVENLQPLTFRAVPQYSWDTWLMNAHANVAGNGIGADLIQADYSLRAPLNLPNDRGLVVTNLVPNGPAAMVGLHPNDILLTLSDKPLDKPEDFPNALEASMGGSTTPHTAALTLLRAGKLMTITVRAVSKVSLAPVRLEPSPDYFIGVTTSPADETLRSHLTLPAGTGIVVMSVVADSPAAKAGMAPGDILLSYTGNPLPASETLRELIQAAGPKEATLAVLRKGAEMKIAVTPEKRKPEPTGAAENGVAPQEALTMELRRLMEMQDLKVANANRVLLVDPQQADFAKKLDDLHAQIQALSKSVEELRKEKK